MEKLIIQIGASSDFYGGFAENCTGVYGSGASVQACKENVMEGLRLFKKTCAENALPDILKGDFEIVYKYDVQSILNHYSSIFSKPALEKLTGINQKLLHHYATGLKIPREPQRKKIENALHNLGSELLSVQL